MCTENICHISFFIWEKKRQNKQNKSGKLYKKKLYHSFTILLFYVISLLSNLCKMIYRDVIHWYTQQYCKSGKTWNKWVSCYLYGVLQTALYRLFENKWEMFAFYLGVFGYFCVWCYRSLMCKVFLVCFLFLLV